VLSWHHYGITLLPYLSPRLSAADDDDETETDVSVVKRDVVQVCLSSVFDVCLEVVSRSRELLCHIRR